MEKKKILIFNDCFYMGGTEILLVNLLNHLVEKDNCTVTLLLPNPSERNVLLERVSSKIEVKYIFPVQLLGVKRWLYKNILIFLPSLFERLTKINKNEYDEVVCFKDGFYSILFSKFKIPRILWIQNQPFEREYKSQNLKEWFSFKLHKAQISRMVASFDKFDRIICVSDTCRRDYINIYHKGQKKKDIEVLYNALDLSGIQKLAEEPIELSQPELFAFVVVIRLSYEKKVERVICATDRLRNEGYHFEVRILGDGQEFEKLYNLIIEYNLQDYIMMYGRVNNPFPYVKRANWFLCPSSRESFALTLLEAISLGTPVITTACGGAEDVIDRGNYGVLVENSSEGVYLGMKKVLDNPNIHSIYTSTAQENLERFKFGDWLEATDNILEV